MSLYGLKWVNRGPYASAHLLFNNGLPLLFKTRDDARAYAAREYGYIKKRPDLRAFPHGWRMPRPVRVTVQECAP